MLLSASAVSLLVVSGCAPKQKGIAGDTLTVYASVPGPQKAGSAGQSVVRGAQLALDSVNGKVGSKTVKLNVLDDTGSDGKPAETKISQNAQKAQADPTTVGYIGELDSRGTATALKILNEAGILEISPVAGAPGLTKKVPGATGGEPDSHYPSGRRTLLRIAPDDTVQAGATAAWAREFQAKLVAPVSDGSEQGDGEARLFELAAKRAGVRTTPTVVVRGNFGPDVDIRGADAVYLAIGDPRAAAGLVRVLGEKNRSARFFAPGWLATPYFYGELGVASGRTFLSSGVEASQEWPEAAKDFATRYSKKYGEEAPNEAIYGYVSMQVIVQAVQRSSKTQSRAAVLKEVFRKSASFPTALGDLRFDQNGDSNLTRVTGYSVENKKLVFRATLKGSPVG